MKTKKVVSIKSEENIRKLPSQSDYTQQDAIEEFEELKKIALNCFDKNGNPNISAALRAVENKAKIANLYSSNDNKNGTIVKMSEITLDGEQLKMKIGEDFLT